MYTKGATLTPSANVPFEDGFFPTKPGYIWAGGLVNYTMMRVAPNSFLTVRNEFWDDPQGYRSSYASTYYEGSFGAQWWPNKLMMVRPEIRFEHAFKSNQLGSGSANDNPGTGLPFKEYGPFDNGVRLSQLTLACDVTYHF